MVKQLVSLKGALSIVLATTLICPVQAFCSSQKYLPMTLGDEETILIEKTPSQKIPYSSIARKLSKRFLDFDTYDVLTYTHRKGSGIARSFGDYMSRSKYRLDVKRDEVELKYSLSF